MLLTAHDIVTLTISLVASFIVLDVFGTIVYVLFPIIVHITNTVKSPADGTNQPRHRAQRHRCVGELS